MLRVILALPFILNTCLPEALMECGNNTTIPRSAACSQILFDDSLKAFYDKKWEKATEGFDDIAKNSREQWRRRAIFMLGRTYLESEKREEARDLLLRAVSEYEELADYSLFYFSESLWKEKNYEKAAETFRLLYEIYPESTLKSQAKFREAESLYLSCKYKDAAEAFEVFLKENPKDPMAPEAKLYKGKALKRDGMIEEAMDVFKRIWIEDPTSPTTDKAREELSAVRLNAEDYLRRAENLLKAYLYPKALIDFKKALELEKNPLKVIEIKLKMGISLFKAKSYKEAIEVLGKLSKERINDKISKEALYYLTRTYLKKGDKEKFLDTSNELYKLYPGDKKTPELLLIMADELRRSGEKEKSLNIYDLIIREYPEMSADALYQRGWMAYLSGEFDKSSKDMRALIDNHPESQRIPQAFYWEARSYDKSGEKSKAEMLYRRIAREYPSSFYGYAASERLNGTRGLSRYNNNERSSSYTYSSVSEIPFPKVSELKILGMKEEAVRELDYLRDKYSGAIGTTEELEALIQIGDAYINLGEYSKAISTAEGHSKAEKRLNYLSYPLGFWPFLRHSSNDTMIDPYLLAALIREESRFDPRAVSRAGAKGLMQVIPSTWNWISKEIKNQKSKIKNQDPILQTLNSELRSTDPFNPEANIARGSWYLKYLLDKFDSNLIIALSAYNAGPEIVSSWIKGGPEELDEFIEEIPYSETRAYIKRVLRSYGQYKRLYQGPEKGL